MPNRACLDPDKLILDTNIEIVFLYHEVNIYVYVLFSKIKIESKRAFNVFQKTSEWKGETCLMKKLVGWGLNAVTNR